MTSILNIFQHRRIMAVNNIILTPEMCWMSFDFVFHIIFSFYLGFC